MIRSALFITSTVAAAVLVSPFAASAAPATPLGSVEAPFAEVEGVVGDYPGGMNEAEFKHCLTNPIDCNTAKGHADQALKAAQQNFSASSLHNGKGDAFRHCYWNARMTIDMGESEAKGFGDRHEQTPGQPQDEKDMDLANNATGRSVGKDKKSYSKSLDRCKELADNGKLVTLK